MPSSIVHEIADHSLHLKDLPSPVPSSSQYLIQVKSTAFTAGELDWPEPNELKETPIPGFDFAGLVIQAPSDSPVDEETYLTPETRVYGFTAFNRPANARCITVAEHTELTRIPDSLDFNTAASIPLSALTAWQALFDHAALAPQAGANTGKRVLVTAASGSVGIWLVQMASWAGAYTVGTCGPKNIDFVKSLGAHEILDYTVTKNLASWAQEDKFRMFDVVVDCVGGETLEQAWIIVKEGGFMNSIALPAISKEPAEGVAPNVRTSWFIVEHKDNQLSQIGELLQQGKLRAKVDSVWNFNDYQKAWDKVKAGHVSGKVVLQVQE